jgi:hypothetical protein
LIAYFVATTYVCITNGQRFAHSPQILCCFK